MYRIKRIVTGLFALSLLLVTNVEAAENKIKHKKEVRLKAPAPKLKKSHIKLKPKHLYVKSDEQLKREFAYRKQQEKEFMKMKKRKEKHLKRERIQKKTRVNKGDKDA